LKPFLRFDRHLPHKGLQLWTGIVHNPSLFQNSLLPTKYFPNSALTNLHSSLQFSRELSGFCQKIPSPHFCRCSWTGSRGPNSS
jgi:hypothetical protein